MAVSKYNLGNIRDNKGGFRDYSSFEEGAGDQLRLLRKYQTKYGLNTLQDIINKWAPPSENDTGNYVNSVSQMTGYKPGEPLDLNNPEVIGRVGHAMARMEKGAKNVPLTQEQYVSLAAKGIANPVSQLPQKAGALSGQALLTAKPQTEAEAVNQYAPSANYEQLQQLATAKALKEQREADAMQAQLQNQQKNMLLTSGAIGLASLLLGKKKNNSTSEQSVGRGAAYDWSAPTQQAIRNINQFGLYRGQ